MTLKAIELAGFKSFGKKSSVSFTTPITAVVGPNGSGKSNIVESIRFVLGEQSMKSLRGKGGIDLIYKGSKVLPSANHAGVSIIFDNSKKIFSFTNSGLGVSLEYDEITISREVFADGSNRYSINSTEVRLKDIVDLLASVNIGSSGHHIISQGEADRVLNASSKDRRAMIEDALGLKVYQFRIKESERKLEKTILNIKEVQSLRREIAPHLGFLKKQVQLIEKSREMRDELRGLYKTYLSAESAYIAEHTTNITHNRRIADEKMLSLDERIGALQSLQEKKPVESEYMNEIRERESEMIRIRSLKDELARKLGRIEGILEGLENKIAGANQTVSERVIAESEWKNLIAEIQKSIDEALAMRDLPEISRILHAMKDRIGTITVSSEEPPKIDQRIHEEFSQMKASRDSIVEEMNRVSLEERGHASRISELRHKESEAQSVLRDSERMLYELLREKNEVSSDIHSLVFEEEKIALIKTAFEMELAEAGVLIGSEALSYARMVFEGDVSRSVQEELRRKIERIKIKLEDGGVGNGSDIMKEYEDTIERDAFLSKEIDDLESSMTTLHTLIMELKETLDMEFKEGVSKINKQFQEFFALMFGGGSAFLAVTMEHKKQKRTSDEEDLSTQSESNEDSESSALGFERGIEINVTLPQKKVKDLHMLSGGERSLTSIALLFAISQVNPPPFLVLDETDAALDEANSRKYGAMLENLSRYSQLIVVTHNRETMSRAQVLYGVTMGAEGASKLLSIRLEDASIYAK